MHQILKKLLELVLVVNPEKRRYPRVDANIDAEVICGDDYKIKVVALDTSSTGLKLQCDAVQRDLLTPRGEWTRDGKPIRVNVTMFLPVSGNRIATIEALCAIAFSRRVSRNCYHVGMQYLNLDGESHKILGKFIASRLHRD